MTAGIVFVTGATGYMGRALVQAAEDPPRGVRVVTVPEIRAVRLA